MLPPSVLHIVVVKAMVEQVLVSDNIGHAVPPLYGCVITVLVLVSKPSVQADQSDQAETSQFAQSLDSVNTGQGVPPPEAGVIIVLVLVETLLTHEDHSDQSDTTQLTGKHDGKKLW